MDSGERLSLAICSIEMRFDPRDVDHAIRLLLSVRGSIQAKRGCRVCEVGMGASDPGLVQCREEWETEEVFHRHVRSEEFRRVLIALDLCCEEPRIAVGNMSDRTGMADLLKLRENVAIPGAFE